MEHNPLSFRSDRSDEEIGMPEAIAIARRSISGMVDLEIDAISKCEKTDDSGWRVVVDLVEAMSRLGENDLLAAYELTISSKGELRNFRRVRRYRREDLEET